MSFKWVFAPKKSFKQRLCTKKNHFKQGFTAKKGLSARCLHLKKASDQVAAHTKLPQHLSPLCSQSLDVQYLLQNPAAGSVPKGWNKSLSHHSKGFPKPRQNTARGILFLLIISVLLRVSAILLGQGKANNASQGLSSITPNIKYPPK